MINLVPDFILENYRKKVFSGVFQAAALFIDISGFTAMTEELMKHGKNGAEELADILKYLFTSAIDAVYDNGGFITTFAGDAFTALFPASETVESRPNSLIAAIKIQNFFLANQKYQSKKCVFEFGAKIGLSFGNVSWGIIRNQEESQCAYYFKGEAIDNAAGSEHQAIKGQIILDQQIKAYFTDLQLVFKKQKMHFILDPEKSLITFSQPVSVCHTQFPFELIELFTGRQEMNFPIGEFRDVISTFISFDQLPDEHLYQLINLVFEKQKLYGGSAIKLDFGDKGGNILLFFGTPVAYENNEQRALEFILSLFKEAAVLSGKIKLRAGLAKGIVYSGFNGAERREEFTCLGNTVNQSARFMMKAEWQEILTDEALFKCCSNTFDFTLVGALNYKGRKNEIITYRLLDKIQNVSKVQKLGKLIGRDHEVQQLNRLLKRLQKGQPAGLAFIHGAAGTGKTRLIEELKTLTTKYNQKPINDRLINWLFLPCDEILRKSFNPFIFLLSDWFEQTNRNDNLENIASFNHKFDDLLNKVKSSVHDPDADNICIELQRTKSFIGALLGLHWDESLFEQLDAKGRFENTLAALVVFFEALSVQKPLIINLEDCHWLDKDSNNLLKMLAVRLRRFPVLIICSARTLDDGTFFDYNLDSDLEQTLIVLDQLNEEASLSLIRNKMRTVRIPSETLKLIMEKSHGNPFYIEQICSYLTENSLLDEKYNLKNTEIAIPSAITSILIARLDRLTTEFKSVLKTASVLGKEFIVSILEAMLKKNNLSVELTALSRYLSEGEKETLWNSLTGIKYLFKHSLIRDVIYDMQLKKHIAALHKTAAVTIESLFPDNLANWYADLAYHYEHALEEKNTLKYLALAGQQAKENYQNSKALEYYEKWLAIAGEKLKISADSLDPAVITVNRKLAEEYIDLTGLGFAYTLRIVGKKTLLLSIYNTNIQIADILGDKDRIGINYFNLGGYYDEIADLKLARINYLKAQNLFTETKNVRRISNVHIGLGALEMKSGNNDTALEHYHESLKISRKISNLKEEARVLGNIGVIYDYQGDYECAKQSLQHLDG